ncbi:hypothetical protein QE385_003234 [Sphingomonas sp. SORGH_AS 950]|uniref:hypothetical protein n=1 Tax=Sphingomonas sp. SORGH_AS_0950 TaxID=3041792 RepID=UPI00277F5B86|nr:hypothetical protein [Sphingomonas sp. SORGH_AS_0950]MDQ1158907.1 hypothetical protein [Sphingomonas sp. SORGH_AS_0950]
MVLSGAERDHLNRKIATLTHAALMRRTLKLTCTTCQRARLLDTVPLWWLWSRKGWDDRLAKAARRFYCAPCWHGRYHAARPRYAITDAAPAGQQFPYPPELEWKRLVSRFRG